MEETRQRSVGVAGDAAETGPDAAATTEEAARDVVRRLQARCLAAGLTVATAESCTGGLVAHLLTQIPGSSGYVLGGVVAYADAIKASVLDVPRAVLDAHGAVSAQVARAMVDGARARFGADVAVAVTGIAGPDGGTAAKPVGLTYIAAGGPAGTEVRRVVWQGDRNANKWSSAGLALGMLLAQVETAVTVTPPPAGPERAEASAGHP